MIMDHLVCGWTGDFIAAFFNMKFWIEFLIKEAKLLHEKQIQYQHSGKVI